MKVRISEIIALRTREREINSPMLKEIEFVDDNDQVIQIDPKLVKDFMFTGLNNCDFIMTEFYRNGWDREKY